MLAAAWLALVVLTCLASLLGLAADSHWVLFFLDQPRVHYVGVLVLGLLSLGLRRCWLPALVVGGALCVNLWLLLPTALRTLRSDGSLESSRITVVHANLGQQPAPADALISWISRQNADVLFFQEVTPRFLEAATGTLAAYQLVQAEARPDTRGVAAFVVEGVHVEKSEVLRLAADVTDRPSITVRLALPAGPLTLLSFHSKRPKGRDTLAVQKTEYADLGAWFREHADSAAVAMGDFNATPWSRRLRDLLSAADLPSDQGAWSLHPTWPAGPWVLFGIPIDLAVRNSRATVLGAEVGPEIGSDHLPVCYQVSIPAGGVQPR